MRVNTDKNDSVGEVDKNNSVGKADRGAVVGKVNNWSWCREVDREIMA